MIWPAVGKNSENALANEKRKSFTRVEVVGYSGVPGEIDNFALEFEKVAEKA